MVPSNIDICWTSNYCTEKVIDDEYHYKNIVLFGENMNESESYSKINIIM
jgi:hypothetical protein